MRYLVKMISLAAFILVVLPTADGQLLDRVMRKTTKKIGDSVEDLVAEKVSDYIAQRVYKSMSDGFDKMLADAYQQDSSYRADYGDSIAIKYGAMSNDWMARLNEAADLPESYHFDFIVKSVSTYKKDEDEMTMYFPNEGGYFAMEQLEAGERRIFLLDVDEDVTVLYAEEGKKKTAQAIPNMMAMAGSMVQSTNVEVDDADWELKEIRGKTILGYKCDGYQATSKEGISKTYISNEVPISWQESFMNSMKKFVVALNGSDEEFDLDGFVLESTFTSSEKSKKDHTWKVTSIDEEPFEIVNADYEFGGMQ